MNFKKWNLAMISLICGVLLFVAAVNYCVDPFGYFAFRSGDYDAIRFPVDTTYFQRGLKINHVRNFSENYDAYLIGGSKAGSYQAETLQELDGYRYYNLYETGGSFYEYKLTTEFLIKYAEPKKIVLNISGGEVRFLKRNQQDMSYRIPAILTGESEKMEFLDFLFLDISESFSRWKERRGGKEYFELTASGQRNLTKYYQAIAQDRDTYTARNVLEKFDAHMKTLFTTNQADSYYEECLEYMQEIKKLCDENGVELLVIVAPSFIGEMSEHDSTYYWEYLQRLSWITDYWDFSGYHEINLNPYNYYNEGHFYYEMTELIVDTIHGTDAYPGFGTYVTKENSAEHMAKRQEDYDRLKMEYEETGTIPLQGWEDQSCLVKG